MIKCYDPDVVFYTGAVDITVVQDLNLFNPEAYVNLDKSPLERDIDGVSAAYLLSEVDPILPVIMPSDIWKTNSPLMDFFELNFGITPHAYVHVNELTRGRKQIPMSASNFNTLLEVIHGRMPVNLAQLSTRQLFTRVLRSLKHAHYEDFEIVIAKDTSNTDDLLYYWNRHLYECHEVMYLTLQQLDIVREDVHFKLVLQAITPTQNISVVSMSCTEEETKQIIADKLQKGSVDRFYQHKKVDSFPFEITDADGFSRFQSREQPVLQTMTPIESHLFIPKLSFTNEVGFYPQKWAIDLQINEMQENNYQTLKFPLTTDAGLIIRDVEGRIQQDRNISYFVSNQHQRRGTVELKFPAFDLLLQILFSMPVIHGKGIRTIYQEIGPHDSSNRLSAFIRQWNEDFNLIRDYFFDKFWRDIFNELATSAKQAGNSISFIQIMEKCKKEMERIDGPLGNNEKSWRTEESLKLGLTRMLNELCFMDILQIGFRLKCPRCSTIDWYSVEESSSRMTCHGCRNTFMLPAQSPFFFRLNTLIQKNMFTSTTSVDGNLTIILTLASLAPRARGAFAYSPQLNLYPGHRTGKPVAELDIIAIAQGALTIGEGKHDSLEFKANKRSSLKSLIEVARAIRPDKILLSCSIDTQGHLRKAKDFVEQMCRENGIPAEVEAICLSQPNDSQLRGNRYWLY